MASTTLISSRDSTPAVAETPRAASTPTVTVEGLCWLALALVALGVRLADLGRWPLSEAEAALALEAWHLVSGQPYTLLGGAGPGTTLSPLAFNLTAWLFTLFGASDTTARLAQALAGSALVLAPWLLRPLLGRGHALAIGGLLLLSPTLLFFSRHASGEIWGALCALLLVAGVARWQQWGTARDGWLAAIALGLGLASGPGFWSLPAGAGLYLLWERWRAGREERPFAPRLPARGEASRFVGGALLLFVLTATALLTNLPGLGAALNLPVQWLYLLFGGGPSLVIPFFFVFLLYELLPFLAGLAALPLLGEKELPWAIFALSWLFVTLVPATLAGSGWGGGLLFALLPLALLAGRTVAHVLGALLEEESGREERAVVGLGLLLLIPFWINLSGYVTATPRGGTIDSSSLFGRIIGTFIGQAELQFFPVLLLLLLLLLFSFGLYATRRGYERMWRLLGLTLLLWLTIVSGTSAWGLSLVRSADPREPLVMAPSHRDLRTVAAQVAQLSIERYREPSAIPVGIQRTLGVAPRWYFRNFENLTIVEGSRSDLPEVVLLDSDETLPGRIGQQVWLGATWQAGELPLRDQLRWLASRQAAQGFLQRSAVLYVVLSQ